jgi:hypothetical protein
MRSEYHESYSDYRWGGAQKARKARDQRARYLKMAGFNVIRSSVGYRIFGSPRLDFTYYLHASRAGTPAKARCNSISPRSNRPGLPEAN